jgi:hypothetical protein
VIAAHSSARSHARQRPTRGTSEPGETSSRWRPHRPSWLGARRPRLAGRSEQSRGRVTVNRRGWVGRSWLAARGSCRGRGRRGSPRALRRDCPLLRGEECRVPTRARRTAGLTTARCLPFADSTQSVVRSPSNADERSWMPLSRLRFAPDGAVPGSACRLEASRWTEVRSRATAIREILR